MMALTTDISLNFYKCPFLPSRQGIPRFLNIRRCFFVRQYFFQISNVLAVERPICVWWRRWLRPALFGWVLTHKYDSKRKCEIFGTNPSVISSFSLQVSVASLWLSLSILAKWKRALRDLALFPYGSGKLR